jgi:hypothetical protein
MLSASATNRRSRKARRVDEFAAAGDQNGAATWRRIVGAVVQLSNNPARLPTQMLTGQQVISSVG